MSSRLSDSRDYVKVHVSDFFLKCIRVLFLAVGQSFLADLSCNATSMKFIEKTICTYNPNLNTIPPATLVRYYTF